MLTDEIAVMVERLTAFANGCRGSMWQSRNETIELCDEAAATITTLRDRVTYLEALVEAFHRGNPPLSITALRAEVADADEVKAIAVEYIAKLEAEVAALCEALEPLARLEIPSKPQGNAGFYSIYHKHIMEARATVAKTRGEEA